MRAGKIALAILVIAALLIGAFLFYASRSKNVVLFYHGGAPEVPQGRVIVVFNPFGTAIRRTRLNGSFAIYEPGIVSELCKA
jgi:hypothetical protein